MEKIVFGCYPSYVSLYFLNLLIRKYKLPISTVLISIKAETVEKTKIKGLKGIFFYIRRFGIRFSLYQIFLSGFLPFYLSIKPRFFGGYYFLSFKQLAKKYGLTLLEVEDFNEERSLDILKNYAPDIFISMGLDQILKNRFIKLFKRACLNIHPAKLPDFRGIDPIFQFLLSNEKQLGVTLHQMTEEIDKGDILLTSLIKRRKDSSHLSLLAESIRKAANLFQEYMLSEEIEAKKQNDLEINYPYKSYPTKKEIKQFNAKCSYWKLYNDFSNLALELN